MYNIMYYILYSTSAAAMPFESRITWHHRLWRFIASTSTLIVLLENTQIIGTREKIITMSDDRIYVLHNILIYESWMHNIRYHYIIGISYKYAWFTVLYLIKFMKQQ